MNSLILAHGVGRIYQSPVPLYYYLTGSALAVLASFLLVRVLGHRPGKPRPRLLLGPRAARRGAWIIRVMIWAGFALALVTGATDNATGFNFASIWLWVGLVVALSLSNVIVGGLWRSSDPWTPIADSWVGGNAGDTGAFPRYAGPVLIYLLFWFELVSGQGFAADLVAAALVVYVLYAGWVRAKFVSWHQMDPFVILYEFASRSSLLKARPDGVCWRSPGAEKADREPMTGPMYVSVFVLLGSTTMDNLRETPGWETAREVLILGRMPTLLYDSLALAVLGLPFLFTFKLALRAGSGGSSLQRSTAARTIGWSLAPVAVAYLLAHNVSLLLVTLPVWFVALSDPLGLGWNLLGLGSLLPEYLPSPALVWFLQVGLVVGGHVMGVVMAHRISDGVLGDERPGMSTQLPLTILMLIYTVGTLWLLSLSVVSG